MRTWCASCLLGERFRDSVRSIGSEFGLTEGTAGDRGAKGRLKVDAVAANTSGEVTDAALALCSRKIDAVCQVMGNLTASSFVAIARATTTRPDAWPPCWLYVSAAGRIRLEFPFTSSSAPRLIVNLDAARAVGLTLPALIGKAEILIGQEALAAGRNTVQ